MKRYITYTLGLLVATSLSLTTLAQTDSTTVEEEVIINTGGMKVIVKEKKVEKTTNTAGDSITRKTETIEITTTRDVDEDEDVASMKDLERLVKEFKKEDAEPEFITTSWNRFHLGLNNLINNEGQLEPEKGYEKMSLSTSNSINFQWNIVTQAMNLFKGKLRLVYGVGIDYNNYRFKNNIRLNTDSVPLMITEDATNYDKNKLVTQHLNVPLMLNYRFSPKGEDGLYLSAGANFGYLIGSHQKMKWDDNGKNKSKIKDDYNLQQFRVGYEVQFGYKNVVLYGKYFPESIFKANMGPDVNSVSAGILIGKI